MKTKPAISVAKVTIGSLLVVLSPLLAFLQTSRAFDDLNRWSPTAVSIHAESTLYALGFGLVGFLIGVVLLIQAITYYITTGRHAVPESNAISQD